MSWAGVLRDEERAEEHSAPRPHPLAPPPSMKRKNKVSRGLNQRHRGSEFVAQTSWICCSRSSSELMVSRFLFRLSRREMSWAANSAGFIGTISLGGRRVRFEGIKRAVSLRHSFCLQLHRSPPAPAPLIGFRTADCVGREGGGANVETHSAGFLKSARFKAFLDKYQTLSRGMDGGNGWMGSSGFASSNKSHMSMGGVR